MTVVALLENKPHEFTSGYDAVGRVEGRLWGVRIRFLSSTGNKDIKQITACEKHERL